MKNTDRTGTQLPSELYIAARHGDERRATQLIERGAPADEANEHGVTPLHAAARYGNVGVMRLLLDAGAEVNAADCDGYTPLHWAVRNGSQLGIRALLDGGADAGLRDRGGLCPEDVARVRGDHRSAEMLRTALQRHDRSGR